LSMEIDLLSVES
uniref:Uncharacterized protein n=1 Tax=Amphimedon queenslandica TaxID=400682 RepID=I1EC44_AMPQE